MLAGFFSLLRSVFLLLLVVFELEVAEFSEFLRLLSTILISLSFLFFLLAKEVDGFFKIVLSGRDALLSTLKVSGTKVDPKLAGISQTHMVR